MKQIKEDIKSFNFYNIRSLLCLSIFILFASCKNDENIQFLYSKTNKLNFYKIIYNDSNIFFINNTTVENKTYRDTSIFIFKRGQYYSKHIRTSNENELLILSNINDTTYEYKNMGKSFLYFIKKNNSNVFKATSINKDSLKFKLKTVIYYDKKYNIFKVEESINNKKTIWTK